MITGSNTNIRHGGKLFHVQTEDSGRSNPHVISHLYHGGTILASEKTRYSEQLDLDSETLAKDVRALIEEQHKKMVERLERGEFDSVIAERLDKPPAPPPTQPALDPVPARAQPRAFGDGIVSQKPLDEVILNYLVEKARDRASDRESKATGRSRKKG